MPIMSPTLASRVSAPARVIHSVPDAGMPRASCSAPPVRSMRRKAPRNGKPSPSARKSPRRSCSPARIMLFSPSVSAWRNPSALAASRMAPVIGASPRTTASPPSRRLASMARARSARSVTKPTAVTATTASTSAANRMRISPAAMSRSNCRHAIRSVFMQPRPRRQRLRQPPHRSPTRRCPGAAGGRSARPGVRRASPAPGWCRLPHSARTAVR